MRPWVLSKSVKESLHLCNTYYFSLLPFPSLRQASGPSPALKRGAGGWAGEWGFREWWVVGVGGVEELYVGLDGWCLWIEFHILPDRKSVV